MDSLCIPRGRSEYRGILTFLHIHISQSIFHEYITSVPGDWQMPYYSQFAVYIDKGTLCIDITVALFSFQFDFHNVLAQFQITLILHFYLILYLKLQCGWIASKFYSFVAAWFGVWNHYLVNS